MRVGKSGFTLDQMFLGERGCERQFEETGVNPGSVSSEADYLVRYRQFRLISADRRYHSDALSRPSACHQHIPFLHRQRRNRDEIAWQCLVVFWLKVTPLDGSRFQYAPLTFSRRNVIALRAPTRVHRFNNVRHRFPLPPFPVRSHRFSEQFKEQRRNFCGSFLPELLDASDAGFDGVQVGDDSLLLRQRWQQRGHVKDNVGAQRPSPISHSLGSGLQLLPDFRIANQPTCKPSIEVRFRAKRWKLAGNKKSLKP